MTGPERASSGLRRRAGQARAVLHAPRFVQRLVLESLLSMETADLLGPARQTASRSAAVAAAEGGAAAAAV